MPKSREPETEQQDRPLPVNVEIERLVLGSCVTRKESLAAAAEILTPEDFSIESHRRIFARMLDIRGIGIIDSVSLAESLRAHGQLESVGGITYLVSLDRDLPALHNIAEWLKILKAKSTLRKLCSIGTDLGNAARDPAANPQEIVSSIERTFRQTLKITDRNAPERITDLADTIGIEDLLNPSRKRGKGIYTGFRALDEHTGGIFPGENWVIGAATGVGKSSTCLQMAKFNAMNGIPVGIFSLEMPKRALFNRLLCQEAGVSVRRFRSGEAQRNSGETRKLLDAFGVLQELPIYIDDSFALRPSDLDSKSKALAENYGVKLGFVDFVQKMRSELSRGNENDRLTEITDNFVDLAKRHFPYVIFSQLSREHRKLRERPGIDDLRGSGSLGQLANLAMFIWREEMEKGKEKDESVRGTAELIGAKNREGPLFKIKMKYIGWRMMLEDFPCEFCSGIQAHVGGCVMAGSPVEN